MEECVALERQLQEDERQQAAVSAQKQSDRQDLVEQLAQVSVCPKLPITLRHTCYEWPAKSMSGPPNLL